MAAHPAGKSPTRIAARSLRGSGIVALVHLGQTGVGTRRHTKRAGA